MTNTWRRSPGAQPPHQQHVRRFGGNVRQRSASSALRLPQGGSRAGAPALDAAGGGTRTRKRKATASGWTGIQLHRRFLNASKQHCRSPRRLDRPSVAPPILNSRKELCRSPRRVDQRSIAPPIPELKQRALPLFQAAGPAFSCTADS
eukprot:SM000198S05324  [mRNA]  locus=s198:255891:257017:+ [translate_table: standard]